MEGITSTYRDRNNARQTKLEEATMQFVAYFMGLGDDQATAEGKVSQVSTEAAVYLFPYVLGNMQPLIDSINASTLPFMDQAAKDKLIQDLS